MRASILIATIIAALSARVAAVTCEDAAAACAFYFKGHPADVPEYNICVNSPDNGPGFSDAILLRDGTKALQTVNSNSPDLWLDGDGIWEKMSTLNTQLSPYQFKPFTEYSQGVTASRIGHETFQGKSLLSAADECYKVSFTNWAYISGGQHVNVNTGTATSCVVFRTLPCSAGGERKLAAGNLRGSHKV